MFWYFFLSSSYYLQFMDAGSLWALFFAVFWCIIQLTLQSAVSKRKYDKAW